MRLFGRELTLFKRKGTLQSVTGGWGAWNWLPFVREPYAGAWQQNVTLSRDSILAFSAVYACVSRIASDFSKLRCRMMEREGDIWVELEGSPLGAVLIKPNRYQNRLKFFETWIVSKMLHGNFYALKERDERGVVRALYPLDPTRVTVRVADDGGVYYQLNADNLSGLPAAVVVPAREIIHDMMVSLWHPLIGVSPIFACAQSATQGIRIQQNSSKFFENMSRPSGTLTAPGRIGDETAKRLKAEWEENFSGNNIGRLAVLGDGLKYEAMTIPAVDAQLIEQLKWTVEDVARCFHVPLYKIGGAVPAGSSIEALQQQYYTDCLQVLFESAKLCLDEGLELRREYGTEFDLDGLLRMDTAARYKAHSDGIGGGWLAPNEVRRKENLRAAVGGNSPMMQQQNYSLAALAQRDAAGPPPNAMNPSTPAPEPQLEDDAEPSASERAIASALIETRTLLAEVRAALPAPVVPPDDDAQLADFAAALADGLTDGRAA